MWIQPRHTGHILIASGGEALMLQCGGGFDEGVADDVGHLAGEGDHPVVLCRSGDGEGAEAAGGQGLLRPVQQVHIVKSRRDQDHRRTLKEVCPAVFEAGELGAGHGVTAHKGEAVFFCQRGQGTACKAKLARLVPGQTVILDRSKQKMAFRSNDLGVVYEDPYLLVIDKRAGLLSMSNNTRQQTVQTVLNRYLEKGGGRNTSHLVHRLDRDTSGLMVYAKDVQTQQSLIDGWQHLVTDRRYIALVEGELESQRGRIQSWLTEDKRFITHSSPVDNGGKYAVTHYNVLASSNGYSLVECELETGRKNQIRVHMQNVDM